MVIRHPKLKHRPAETLWDPSNDIMDPSTGPLILTDPPTEMPASAQEQPPGHLEQALDRRQCEMSSTSSEGRWQHKIMGSGKWQLSMSKEHVILSKLKLLEAQHVSDRI